MHGMCLWRARTCVREQWGLAPYGSVSGGGESRFVCEHCTSTGLLSNLGLFLSWAQFHRHIAQRPACKLEAAGLGSSCKGRSVWRPEPAMSWPEREARRVRRKTSGTSHHVTRNKIKDIYHSYSLSNTEGITMMA
jgi:hypothetical protein